MVCWTGWIGERNYGNSIGTDDELGNEMYEIVKEAAAAIGARFQSAFGRRSVLRTDVFARYGEERDTITGRDADFGYGGRIEWTFKL